MRCGLIQMTSTDQPGENLEMAVDFVDQAVAGGAGFVLTPEVTNCVSGSRSHQTAVLTTEGKDPVLAGLRARAAHHGIWMLIGSLGLKVEGGDGRFANRSFVIAPDGQVAARYDKIHMFDVDISETESYRESEGYRPGDRAVVAQTPFGVLGLGICYDLRFAQLHRRLAKAGAEILTQPAAFSPETGRAHWEVLLRARGIETGCYVLAPAQTGQHPVSAGRPRATYGHSLAIAPWGEVLADGGTDPGVVLVDIDRAEVAHARRRVPAIHNDREFSGP
ncbi:MAG: carbon-nitrogen hydrolase family protein [Qingshengfaniella sp.]